MTITKTFFLTLILFFTSAVLMAQEATVSQEMNMQNSIIKELHSKTGADLLITEKDGTVVLSKKYYNSEEIPERVVKLIKESLLKDTDLALKTVKEFKDLGYSTSEGTNVVFADKLKTGPTTAGN